MGLLKWYKRDPRAALIGMQGMTNEEAGAYNRILDLIYCHDGALPDSPEYIRDVLNCTGATWRRLRARLLGLGKIYIRDSCLRNERADTEVEDFQIRWLKSIKMNDKRWAALREIKQLRDRQGLLSTTTKINLSANIVPISKKPTDKKE